MVSYNKLYRVSLYDRWIFTERCLFSVSLADMYQGIKTGSRILLEICVKWGMRYIIYISAAVFSVCLGVSLTKPFNFKPRKINLSLIANYAGYHTCILFPEVVLIKCLFSWC